MWDALVSRGGPLDDCGALSHLRLTSQKTLMLRYGQWLQWISSKDVSALALDPIERATLERLRCWLGDLDHLAHMTQLMNISGVLRILYVAYPEADWSSHRKLRAHLKRLAGRGTQLRKVGRVLSSAVLLEAGIHLATMEAQQVQSDLYRAIHIRDGAIVALLALLPIRRRALASLKIGESFVIDDDRITVALPSELTKSGRPWESNVPDPVKSVLALYLTASRPFLLARGSGSNNYLWVDANGNGLSYNYIGPRIAWQTRRMTGVSVPPHFFRDAAATTLVRISAQGARLVQPVLGHSNNRTADRHYNHAKTIEAGRDYAALVSKLKKGA